MLYRYRYGILLPAILNQAKHSWYVLLKARVGLIAGELEDGQQAGGVAEAAPFHKALARRPRIPFLMPFASAPITLISGQVIGRI